MHRGDDGSGGGIDDCNVEGTCNEPSAASGGACNPSVDGAVLTPPLPTTKTRDAYNVADLSNDNVIPGSQSGERQLNCVDGADD